MWFYNMEHKKLQVLLICIALFVCLFVMCGFWLYYGRSRPLIDKTVLLEAGNSGADYRTGVEVNLSYALRIHPFASTFNVKADFLMGSGGYNRTVIYDRQRHTIREHIFSYGAHEKSRESEWIYQNVADNDLHHLVAIGKFLEELPFVSNQKIKRQSNLKKKKNPQFSLATYKGETYNL